MCNYYDHYVPNGSGSGNDQTPLLLRTPKSTLLLL
jgi:hypothetical protein